MKKDIQKEFVKLYLTGRYTQKEIAETVGISTITACKWVREIQPLKYFSIRKNLTKRLDELSLKSDYENNADRISQLISDIERIDSLIRKAKYIPHLTGNN